MEKYRQHVSRKISFLSFISALGIVIYHTGTVKIVANEILESQIRFCNAIGFASLGFFFFLTGFLLYNDCTTSNYKLKIERRLRTLVVPFLIWNTIFLLKDFISHRDCPTDFATLLLKFSFSPADGPLWYIFTILLLLVILPIMIRITKFYYGAVIVVSLICGFIFTGLKNQQGDFPAWALRFFRYLPLYLWGGYIGRFYNSLVWNENYNVKKAQILSLIYLGCWAVSKIWIVQLPDNCAYISSIPIPLCLWGMFKASLFMKTRSYWHLSFFIYASHFLLLPIFVRVCNMIPFDLAGLEIVIFTNRILFCIFIIIAIYIFSLIGRKVLGQSVFSCFSGGRV